VDDFVARQAVSDEATRLTYDLDHFSRRRPARWRMRASHRGVDREQAGRERRVERAVCIYETTGPTLRATFVVHAPLVMTPCGGGDGFAATPTLRAARRALGGRSMTQCRVPR
jgi:hypothetical protein